MNPTMMIESVTAASGETPARLIETMAAVAPAAVSAEEDASPPAITPFASAVIAGARPNVEAEADRAEVQQRLLCEQQTALVLARANAEQARRVATSQRGFITLLLANMTQPCFALDEEGSVIFWNEALAAWSALPTAQATGKAVNALFCPKTGELLARHVRQFFAACQEANAEVRPVHLGPLSVFPDRAAGRLTLLPRYHLDGCMESVIILVAPTE